MRKPHDPLLKHQHWRIFAVFHPLESVLDRLERDGTVDTVGRQIVFREASAGDLYDLPAALRADILSCKRKAMALRVSQAAGLIDAVRIGAEVDRLGLRRAA